MAPKRLNQDSGEVSIPLLYDELDRLEELLEDMAELNVTSAADAERRIAELNAKIDELENGDAGR